MARLDFAAALAAAAVLLALAAFWARTRREGLWFDRWPSANERETFSPDAPGACCGGRGRGGPPGEAAAARLEAAALGALGGV